MTTLESVRSIPSRSKQLESQIIKSAMDDNGIQDTPAKNIILIILRSDSKNQLLIYPIFLYLALATFSVSRILKDCVFNRFFTFLEVMKLSGSLLINYFKTVKPLSILR